MKTVAIIQARMGSTRLPGKILKRLSGRTVLGHVIRRVQSCPMIETVVIATTESANDDVVESEARRHGAEVFRGSEEDVLARYYHAALSQEAEDIVRVTSDCPLIDPQLLEAMIRRFSDLQRRGDTVDYLSNTLTRSYPRGLDAEVFPFATLERAYREAKLPQEREHVTPYVYFHPEVFRLQQFTSERNLSAHRWTLDTVEDLQLLTEIFDELGDGADSLFTTETVLELLQRRPELQTLNAHIEQKKIAQ